MIQDIVASSLDPLATTARRLLDES